MSRLDKIYKLSKLKNTLEQICEEDWHSDPIFIKAANLKEAAWDLLFSKKNYNPQKALKLAKEAASLHPEFESQIQVVKNYIDRKESIGKVSYKKTIKNIFFPELKIMGFEMVDWAGNKVQNWTKDTIFKKIKNNVEVTINVGPAKFGHKLGIMIIKKISEADYEFLKLGIPIEEMEYLNQEELDTVINKVIIEIRKNLVLWF